MGIKTLFTMALATGFAAAKPINTPAELPAYPMSRRQGNAVQNGFGGQGFNFIDGFNRFNDQAQVVQVKQESLQIQNNGFQQQVVQQVNEVLVVNQQQNGFNRDLNNLFRKANFRRERNQESTVMLVVQQIQVSVADDRGNAFQQDVFVQSAIVANRGARTTNTVMLFESQAIIATQVLGGRGNGLAGIAGVGNGRGTNAAVLPTKTADVQLFGARPTWSVIAEDPAATLGAVWQAELEDLQKADQDAADNQANDQAAQQVKASLDKANQEQQQQQASASQSAETSQSAEATSTTSAAAEATSAAE
ncbi:hypothetical protein DPSP01_004622 [Paraphaeosphaeria sporulosa]|uniref:Uncharacterized protein n=1 Tax=Paraphaeosphaeria sporulosa TaxID=1460663 RepID=A0A177C934_9PLEO|nr:uncharacterized protein CC84DRAFT_1207274 [Paraphaeosphaeria sporulosa]OAG04075.1 hypothetical protein CC84DRAFT_1207274 [Paraphaeosphaeria sporulosa]